MQYAKNEDMYKEAGYVARHFVKSKGTVRKVASELNMSKSTVHRRLIEFMESPETSKTECELSKKVKLLLEKNKQERSSRGGATTKSKLMKIKAKKMKMK